MKVKSDYIIYCDESCPLEYEPVTLFGAISCSYNKKDQIVKDLRNLKNKYFINSRYETKWIKVSKTKLDYYKELIDYFYNNNDIKIRILVAIDKERLNNEKYNGGEYQEWYYKMYYYLLENFIKSDCSYYMFYDEKDKYTTYRMNKVKDIIINKLGKNEHFDFKIKQINSKESELMQLLDVVMGAVGYKNRGFLDKEKGYAKKEIVKYIEKIFNQNISLTTSKFEPKFNIFIWEPRKEESNFEKSNN